MLKADKLYIGNFTTLEEDRPFAEALTVVGNRIQYVGTLKEAKLLCDDNTEIFDYSGKYIYPGFLDAHTHGMFAGYRSIGQAYVANVNPPTKDEYRKIINDFIKSHPNKEAYLVAGWLDGLEDENNKMDRAFLDELCPDKPLMLNSSGSHSLLLNSVAMKQYKVDSKFVEKWGKDLVRVDENGEPTGYVCEAPTGILNKQLPVSVEDAKEYILYWQDFAIRNGFVGVCDAGIELVSPNALPAYIELDKDNKLKFYTFGYTLVKDNADNIKKCADYAHEIAEKFNSDHFKIIGSKVFLDGVLEAHTCWLTEEFNDEPGYFGNKRFCDAKKMIDLLVEDSKYGLSVHAHSVGDGATKFMLDCIEEAQKITGNTDQRNALAHLQLVQTQDIARMAKTNSIAIVPPLWTPAIIGNIQNEINMIGKVRYDNQYPIKSFFDVGADVAFHSDYPIIPSFGATIAVYASTLRGTPHFDDPNGTLNQETVRSKNEAINRKQALDALTKNVAYMWHQEDNLGSLKENKIANLTILDTDILNCDDGKLINAKVLGTVIDGNLVYSIN